MKKRPFKKSFFKKMKKCDIKNKNCNCHGCGGGVYFFGFIGAAVYYIQHTNSFWMGVLGVLKAVVWPAILVYKSLGFF